MFGGVFIYCQFSSVMNLRWFLKTDGRGGASGLSASYYCRQYFNRFGLIYCQAILIKKTFFVQSETRHQFIVIGRIRTCAGKPQWVSSPSPWPLGHDYLGDIMIRTFSLESLFSSTLARATQRWDPSIDLPTKRRLNAPTASQIVGFLVRVVK